jgi:hypothetical protein
MTIFRHVLRAPGVRSCNQHKKLLEMRVRVICTYMYILPRRKNTDNSEYFLHEIIVPDTCDLGELCPLSTLVPGTRYQVNATGIHNPK